MRLCGVGVTHHLATSCNPGDMTRDDALRARIREVVADAHREAEHASEHERALELAPNVDTPEGMIVRINHRASAIAWTTVANALEALLD
jgi:hypothetical protein